MIEKINNVFHLSGKNISYIMAATGSGMLVHSYFGKKIRVTDSYRTNLQAWDGELAPIMAANETYEKNMTEYPAYGYGDFHLPAYQAENTDGNYISYLTYKDYRIFDGVPEIDGMPGLFAGDSSAQTLEVTLEDKQTGLEVVLSYTVFDEYNIIARSARLKNTSDRKITLKSAYSSCLELKAGNYELIHFAGSWARERELVKTPIGEGARINVSNERGASGHNMNPFVMIAENGAGEENGNVYSMSLVYSGNHSTMVECDLFSNIRITQGINPMQFSWDLGKDEEFCTPQSIMCYSENGIGGISRELADVYRNNLCRSKWTHRERPILINNWEATYFDFDEDKLLSIAKKAKETGVELFVLDDGWFGVRNSDNCSLGDWVVNREKLPSGIDGLAKKINDIGLKFGLWFEPEMVNPNSDLYRAHPDWAISVPGREPVQGRHQYILDLSREDVCDYVIKAVSDVLASANISYVKWDMNRAMTDMPCAGYNHKYILGLYKIMSAITEAFPEVLFEGCAGGGGRFDAGILAYMPQIWTSDNSDAIARLKIQYSTSMGYPVSAISAHVTAVPNHQNGRVTPLKTRADVAYAGVFGYELDITKMTDEELDEVKEQIKKDKKLRRLMQEGDFYRIVSPYEGNYCTWEMVSKDKSEVFVMSCRVMALANSMDSGFKLNGLDPEADYRDEESGLVYGGDELMYRGIRPKYAQGDYSSITMHLVRV